MPAAEKVSVILPSSEAGLAVLEQIAGAPVEVAGDRFRCAALTVARLTDAIGRALTDRQTLEGASASQLEMALTEVLIDMGFGDDDPLNDPDGYAGRTACGFADFDTG